MSTYKIYYSYSTGTPGTYVLPVFEGVQVVHLVLFIHMNRFGKYFHYHVCAIFLVSCLFPGFRFWDFFSYKSGSRDNSI